MPDKLPFFPRGNGIAFIFSASVELADCQQNETRQNKKKWIKYAATSRKYNKELNSHVAREVRRRKIYTRKM